jgi:RNA polymerase sigma factor (sigma-70 family)
LKPENYREVITLSRVVGLSHREIGEQIGKNEGAVRVLLHRALARLGRLMDG